MIKISVRAYNKLARALLRHRKKEDRLGVNYRFPSIHLLCSKGDTIKDIVRLERDTKDNSGQCHKMSRILGHEIINKSLKTMRRGYTIVGIVRVGDFSREGSRDVGDGYVYSELFNMHPEAIFATMQPKSLVFQRVRGPKTTIPYRITQ